MNLKIIFAGTPEFAVAPLKALLQSSHSVLAVYTQPDRPAGRGRQLHESPVKQVALQHHIPVFQPKTLRDPKEQQILRDLKPDVLIVVAYGLILPKVVLDIPKYGCINIHASILPRWRGASPIQQAILAGDPETGVSIMQMDAGLDTGDVLSIFRCSITPEETSQTLHDKLSQLGSNGIIETLRDLTANKLSPQTQDNALATYAAKISKEEAKINWHESAIIIDQKIRGYNPWPVAFTEINNHGQLETVRIWQATPIATDSNLNVIPGTIIKAIDDILEVKTGNGVLRILELQLAGGKRLPTREILKSKRQLFSVGSKFGSPDVREPYRNQETKN